MQLKRKTEKIVTCNRECLNWECLSSIYSMLFSSSFVYQVSWSQLWQLDSGNKCTPMCTQKSFFHCLRRIIWLVPQKGVDRHFLCKVNSFNFVFIHCLKIFIPSADILSIAISPAIKKRQAKRKTKWGEQTNLKLENIMIFNGV